MKEIKRDLYLKKLIDRKENDLIKIITGIRRCGKSYLLDPIFKRYLTENGVDEEHIIKLELDSIENKEYRNPNKLYEYVMQKITDDRMYYILLDEIQKVEDFESVLNSFLRKKNLDVYVTGSNSKFLSSDIVTEFRGRGDEIRVFPLSFSEFFEAYEGDKRDAFNEYITYGGMPYILSKKTEEAKSTYLNNLFDNTYINDIVERNHIQKDDKLSSIINMIASSIGSLTNPNKIENTFKSNNISDITIPTINNYLNYLIDAFLINKAERFDIRGKKYISTPSKYYFTDVGLRNARLNFRQQEETHLMENVIYNELLVRGYNVDVGVVEINEENKEGKKIRKQIEVDFVCNQGSKRYYVQSAFAIPDKEKMRQEQRPFNYIQDSFKKIIVVRENIKLWRNEEGTVIMGIEEFLLNKNSLDL